MTRARDETRRGIGLKRRTVLAAGALGAAVTGCRRAGVEAGPRGAETAQTSDQAAEAAQDAASAAASRSAPSGAVTPQTIAEAEKLAQVEYSPGERTQILEVIDDYLDHVRARRAIELPLELPPAVTFDPRLPGVSPPDEVNVRPAGEKSAEAPGSQDDVAFASLAELATWLRAGEITSTELTELYLDRLERHGETLECVATVTRERALERAAQADEELRAGRPRGPLHGIPYGAKDLLDTAGVRTGFGAEPYRERVPDADAFAIRALDDAGAVLVAKLSLGALAYGDIWYGGRTRNPWNPAEGSSGSSSGSAAAVAAGLVGFSLGTETLGSLTAPAIRCGAASLRPTFGLVPRSGAMPLCWSLDKIGPMARRAEDLALALAPLVGAHDGDPGSTGGGFDYDGLRGLSGRRVGYVPDWVGRAAEPGLDAMVLEVLRESDAEVVEVDWPELPADALMPILFCEAAAAFEELTLSGRDAALTWQEPAAWPNTFRTARFLSGVDLVQAERLRRRAMAAMHDTMAGLDALVAPAGISEAVTLPNFTGHPALTLRTGFFESATRPGVQAGALEGDDRHRVPYGTSLIGKLYGEGTLVEIGGALEKALGVWQARPALSRGPS